MIIASVWLGLCLLLCAYSWAASRRLAAILLPVSAIVAAASLWIATGSPRFTSPPPAKYTVVGADIQVDVAIFVLLKTGNSPPVYYKLPYSTSAANSLQQALDAAQGTGSGGVKAEVGEDGGVAYDGPPPVSGEPPKVPEQPAATIP